MSRVRSISAWPGAEAGSVVLSIPLNALAEPARGGFHRYLAWTVARLPLPREWLHARRTLAPLVAELDERPNLADIPQSVLTDTVLSAYRLQRRDLTALLSWAAP